MSKYTTEIRFICEQLAGLTSSQGFNSIDDVIKKARPKIFNFDYPIFSLEHKEQLECKILRSYYTREICEETFGLWQLRLSARLNEIMPYYNQLYLSELKTFDPFSETDFTVDSTKNGNQKVDSTNNQTSSSDSSTYDKGKNSETTGTTTTTTSNSENESTDNNLHWDKFNDTPQGGLDGVEGDSYLTNARKVTDDKTNSGTSKNNASGSSNVELSGTNENESSTKATSEIEGSSNSVSTNSENTLTRTKGKTSSTSYAKLLNEYRSTFLNIDKQIIDDLKDLFILLWE